jgi:ribonuclease BN (tRNA processing enzyme)
VTTARVNHPVECHGIRLEAGGRSLTYSGDTDRCTTLVDLARDADLFLCEASWPDGPAHPEGIHLTGRTAGEQAARAGARRLMLTHLVPWADPDSVLAGARSTYDGPLELARCGATYEV